MRLWSCLGTSGGAAFSYSRELGLGSLIHSFIHLSIHFLIYSIKVYYTRYSLGTENAAVKTPKMCVVIELIF